MPDAVPHPDASLPDALVARARAASDGRLAVDVVGGLAVAIASVAWHPGVWPVLVSVGLCFASFGAWGIADREIAERPTATDHGFLRVLQGVRALSVVVGTASVLALMFSILGLALGTWIS